jgi:hypothetical protein
MNARALCLFMAANLFVVASCSNNEDRSPDPARPFPYAKPPASTMQLDIRDLEQEAALAPTGVCHALSALAVAWIDANVILRLALPSAAFDACLHQMPVYLGSDVWRWTAFGGVGQSAWTAELSGQLREGDQIDWAMRISGTMLDLDQFLWFDGSCDVGARSGIWHYYDPGTTYSRRELVRCVWSLPMPSSEDRELEFENVTTGSAEFGDILRYELADSIADITFLDTSQPATSRVHWDLRDGVGMAISATGDTCCWGARSAGYPDVECP